MRVTVDNTYYHESVNLSENLSEKFFKALPMPCAIAIVFGTFFWLARLALRA